MKYDNSVVCHKSPRCINCLNDLDVAILHSIGYMLAAVFKKILAAKVFDHMFGHSWFPLGIFFAF